MIYIVGILFILIVSAVVLRYIPLKPIMRSVCFGLVLGIIAYCLISEPYRIARIVSDITVLLG